MGHAGRASVAASLVVGLAAGWCGAVPAYAGDAAKVRELYDRGMMALQGGEYDKALEAFKALLQEDPSQDQVLDLIRATETRHFLKMLSKGGESEMVARRMLDLGRTALRDRNRDPDVIRPLVQSAVTDTDLEKRRMASRTLMANHGAFAVPFLVGYLGSNDTNERVNTIMALEDIGLEAVLPLVEALQSPDAQTRQNVVVVLRRLVDPRAYPILQWLAGSKDQPASVRDAATAALDSYRGFTGSKATSAQDAFIEIARMYYKRSPEILRDLGTTYTLWRWEEGGLKYTDVPGLMYHLRLAEKACLLAVKTDPSTSQKAQAVLSIVYAAQQVALHNAPEAFRTSEAGQAEATRLAMADAAIRANGPAVLERGLSLAIEWNDAPVAVAILNTIPTFGSAVSLGADSAVVKALASGEQSVQWAAALCCIRLAPKSKFPRCELVVPLAADAVSLGAVRQVLIIEPDTKTSVQLQTELNKAGLHTVVSRSGADGLVTAKQARFDAVIVSSGVSDVLAQSVVNEIRRDARTASTPVLMLTAESKKDGLTELMGDSIAGVITLPASANVYVPQVQQAVSNSPLDDRARALALSEAACEVLAMANPSACFDFRRAEAALVGTLATDKSDSLKLKALAALRRWGSAASLGGLLGSLSNDKNAEAVRAESAAVAGSILSGNAPSAKGFEMLLAGLSDPSVAVRTACAGALGSARLTGDQRAMVLAKAHL
jgi:CheY-like chemotaxis protein